MNKTAKIIIEVAVIVGLVGAGTYFYLSNKTAPPNVVTNKTGDNNQITSATDTIPVLPVSEILVPSGTDKNLLVITLASDDFAYIEADAKSGMTAFDLLKQGGEEIGLEVQSKDYGDMGVLVEQIDNLKNGADNKFWIYYVNGQMAQVSASKYILKGGDKVEWRFEASKF